MTSQQINIAIAEACGWKWFSWGKAPDETNRFIASPDNLLKGSMVPCERPSHGLPINVGDVPNYHGSLDAMHEAVAYMLSTDRGGNRWSAKIWGEYVENLISVVTRGHPEWMCRGSSENCIEATAAQRAEAFLRTIGKWKTK